MSRSKVCINNCETRRLILVSFAIVFARFGLKCTAPLQKLIKNYCCVVAICTWTDKQSLEKRKHSDHEIHEITVVYYIVTVDYRLTQ